MRLNFKNGNQKNEKVDLEVGWVLEGKTPIYLRIFIFLPQKLWAILRNENGNLHFWKKRKIDSYQIVSQFTIKPFKKLKYF